jgi:FMN phosphatase YigB (HAD superfamily)
VCRYLYFPIAVYIVEKEMSLFIDDKQSNLEQAQKYGIEGYLFTSLTNLTQDWEALRIHTK